MSVIVYIKKIVVFAIVILIGITFISCDTNNPVIGTWTYPYGKVEFRSDGEMIISRLDGLNLHGQWKLKKGNIIYITGEEYFGELKGNTIIAYHIQVGWTGGDGIILSKK